MRTRYRIVSKARFFVFIILIFILVAASLLLLLDRKEVHSSSYYANYKEFHVIEGDTLWDIASIYLSPGEDIRKTIYEIKKINNMSSGYIYPGDVLKIPIND